RDSHCPSRWGGQAFLLARTWQKARFPLDTLSGGTIFRAVGNIVTLSNLYGLDGSIFGESVGTGTDWRLTNLLIAKDSVLSRTPEAGGLRVEEGLATTSGASVPSFGGRPPARPATSRPGPDRGSGSRTDRGAGWLRGHREARYK